MSRNRRNNVSPSSIHCFFYFFTLFDLFSLISRHFFDMQERVPLNRNMLEMSREPNDVFSSELSAEGAKRDMRRLQLLDWSPPDDPF